ncbi:hypothetical protein EJD97_018955, partial [Solanum chilense]
SLPTEEHDLMSLVGKSFKNSDLVNLLKREDTPRNHKESLCLLWFTHNILLSKDPSNNIIFKYVNFCQDIEAFNNYPWAYESFHLTVDCLLRPLGEKINNLCGFPWAFMVWAFEVIPYLTHQLIAERQRSSRRMLRWLISRTNITKEGHIPDLF